MKKRGEKMPISLMIGIGAALVLLVIGVVVFRQKKKAAEAVYYSEQIRRDLERRHQIEENERMKRMMQRERANRN